MGTTRQRIDTGKQLGKREWLCEIVIPPALQTLDAIVDTTKSRKEEDRDIDTNTPERSDDSQPINLRQHAIDNHEVVSSAYSTHQAILAVGCVVSHMPRFIESIDNVTGRVRIIFDNKDSHNPSASLIAAEAALPDASSC